MQGRPGRQARRGEKSQELRASPAGPKVLDYHRTFAAGLDDRQDIARSAAIRVLMDHDGHFRAFGSGDKSQPNRAAASKAPTICAAMKAGTSTGRMPENVSQIPASRGQGSRESWTLSSGSTENPPV